MEKHSLRRCIPVLQSNDVLANTGWKLRVAENVSVTSVPSVEELAVMRELDPQNFWTK